MRVLYFDPIVGASGDMILAALVDCGVPKTYLAEQLSFIPGFTMKITRVTKKGVSARRVQFTVTKKINEKRFLPLIKRSKLSGYVKKQAKIIIERIFTVEKHVHRAKTLHLHELADADTLLDICGCLVAIEHLKIDRIYSRPLKAGKGFIKTVEGNMPAFNFATAYLLKGFPVEFMPIPAELTTPTGAAIISTIATASESIPISRIEQIGMGVGNMTFKDYPNLMRIFVGSVDDYITDTCTVLETNIDDMNPQDYEDIIEKLYGAGALEVMITPTYMKKTRPGVLITVLCQHNHYQIRDVLLKDTTTLGIRMYETKRWKLRRTIKRVTTPYGSLKVKIARIGQELRFTLEYKDIKRIAHTHKRSVLDMRTQLTQIVAEKLRGEVKE